MKESKTYLTPKKAAAYLKVSTETVRQWAKSGQLPAETTLGGHRRFNIEDVEKFAATLQGKAGETKQIRVLIVDDNEQYVGFVEELLKTFSEELVIGKAFDGLEAIEKLDAFKPDIILLDLVMPNIDQIVEVCHNLKANEATRNIRIIAITGFTSNVNSSVSNLMKAGAEAVLAKPFDHNVLKDLILRKESQVG